MTDITKTFDAPKSNIKFTAGQKSKGILDDYAIRGVVNTKEGTIEKTPVNANDIANKAYVDAGGGAGDVTAAVNLTDATIVQGDGGAKGVKTSTATVGQVATNVAHVAGDGSDHADVATNTTHRTSDGSDHTFINQNVTTTGTPEFGITTLADTSLLKTTAAPTADAQIANKKYVDDNIPAASEWVLLDSVEDSTNDADVCHFTGLPTGTYSMFVIIGAFKCSTSGQDIYVRFNGATDSAYSGTVWEDGQTRGVVTGTAGVMYTDDKSSFGNGVNNFGFIMTIPEKVGGTAAGRKDAQITGGAYDSPVISGVGYYGTDTDPLDEIHIYSSTTNITQRSIQIFGLAA